MSDDALIVSLAAAADEAAEEFLPLGIDTSEEIGLEDIHIEVSVVIAAGRT